MTRLTPPAPPGPATRKARAYGADITQLHAQGYTLESIRQALAAVGIEVSISTVWRETHRGHRAALASSAASPSAASPSTAPMPSGLGASDACPPLTPCAMPPLAGLNGKEVAEAFGRSQSANPFARAKESS